MFNYDVWLTNDYDFDKFHGLLPEVPEVPDFVREMDMEKLREKYKIDGAAEPQGEKV